MLLYQHQNRKDQIFRRLKSYHQQILIISSLMWIILLKDYIIHNVSKKKKKKTKQNKIYIIDQYQFWSQFMNLAVWGIRVRYVLALALWLQLQPSTCWSFRPCVHAFQSIQSILSKHGFVLLCETQSFLKFTILTFSLGSLGFFTFFPWWHL